LSQRFVSKPPPTERQQADYRLNPGQDYAASASATFDLYQSSQLIRPSNLRCGCGTDRARDNIISCASVLQSPRHRNKSRLQVTGCCEDLFTWYCGSVIGRSNNTSAWRARRGPCAISSNRGKQWTLNRWLTVATQVHRKNTAPKTSYVTEDKGSCFFLPLECMKTMYFMRKVKRSTPVS